MGGKKQRTKGNVKPSSSQRTAELLSASGVTGFVGFSGFTSNLEGYVPPSGQQSSDDVEASVDGDFRLVMRKMTKRDTVTKIKALQEFSQLCQEKDVDLVKGAIPFWPRLYKKLSLDNDRRLREATHAANEQLLIKVKKNIAPFLKSMMGVWLVSLCDPYAPAASTAKNALNSAIPAAKQADAMDFCKEEIFQYFQDILFVQTPKTLSTNAADAAAEMEERYCRLVAGCLKAIKVFLGMVESQDTNRDRIEEIIINFLEEDKFWKYAKHKDSQIRSAWYALVSPICQFLGGEKATKYAHKLCPLTLGRLADADPVVASLIWDASLCLLVHIKDCWEHVNISKAFLPQLWNFLKEGGKGSASVIFPSVLPLLSKIPSSVLGDEIVFYRNFFTNLRQGLFLDKVQSSPAETNAIVSAFVECLKYVQLRHNSSSEIDATIREDLVHQLLPMLKSCITDSYNLYPKLGALLLYLENQLKNDESAVTVQPALTSFWIQFISFCETIMAGTNTEAQTSMLTNLGMFYHNLHTSTVKSVKQKVKFEVQTGEESVTDNSIMEPREWASNSPLVDNTQKLCLSALRHLEVNSSSASAYLLFEMCKAVCSRQLFSFMLGSCTEQKTGFSNQEAPVVFFRSLILPLLLRNSANKEIVQHLIDLAFVVCSCTTQECMFELLHDLCQSKDVVIVEEIICKAAHDKHGPLKDWLRSDQVGELVLEMAKNVADVNSTKPKEIRSITSSWRILNLCLASSKNFEPVIKTDYLKKLLDIFHESIQSLQPFCREQSSDITQVIEFVCNLALNLFDSCMDCWCIPAVEKLLLTLFHFSCQSNELPLPVKEQVEKTWCKGTEKLVSLRGGLLNEEGFLYMSSKKIHNMIVMESHFENRNELIESLTMKLLTSVYKALPESQENESCLLTSATICALLQVIFPLEENWLDFESRIDRTNIFVQLLRGDLHLAPFCYEYKGEGAPCLVLSQVSKIVLGLFLKTLFQGGDYCMLDDAAAVELVMKHLPHIVLSTTYEKLSLKNIPLQTSSDVIKLLNIFNWEDVKRFLELLVLRAKEKGYAWSLCLSEMVLHFGKRFSQVGSWLNNLVQLLEFSGEASVFHTLQCLSSQLDNIISEKLASKTICHLVSIQDLLSPDVASYLTLLSNLKFTDEVKVVTEFLAGIRNSQPTFFLSESLLTGEKNAEILFSASTALFFKSVISKQYSILSHENWDAILCSLTGWIQSCDKSRKFLLKSTSSMNFASQTLHLLYVTCNFMKSEEAAQLFNGELITEWKDLYLENIYSALLHLFLWMCDASSNVTTAPIQEIVKLMAHCLTEAITADNILQLYSNNNTASSREDIDYRIVTTRLYPLLVHPLLSVQSTAHKICYLLIEKLPHLSDCTLIDDSEDEKIRPPPDFIEGMLESTSQVVETLLSDFIVGDCCLVEPNTDAFTYAQAYLFTWLHMLKFFSTASSEERSEFAAYLQKQNYLESLLTNLFRMMPKNPSLSEKVTVTPTRGGFSRTLFTEQYDTSVTVSASSHGLQHLACQVYLETLRKLPAMVRQWWTNQDNRTTDIVNKYTTDYVSSYICLQEIKSVQVPDIKFQNMTVRARPTAREVVARYSVDEITIELVIRLPPNHPLGPVQVETCQRVGVGQTQWRNWLLQLTTFLTYQNGSILDGLSLWKCNVDKRFEGVEECMICFYVLHGSTCQLPKLMCKTCKKKYHSACLYKWFSTSNNSACPLCRNLF